MNKIFIGLAIGGFVGFIVGSKWTENKLDEKYAKDFEEYKHSYKERHDEPTPEAVELVKQAQEQMKKYSKEEAINMANPAEDGYGDLDEKEIVSVKGPYVITYEEYHEAEEYREQALTWDSDMGVLTYDEDDTIVDDIDCLVSFEAIEALDNMDGDVIYVRNDVTMTDYIINKVPMT